MDPLVALFPGLRGFPHVDLGVRPTPVERRRIGGLDVLVKRDDLTCGRYGGNKARCLEFLLARRARRVLTYSSLSAHHAYATAVHAAHLGMPCDAVIVRRGRAGATLAALRGTGARVVLVGGAWGAVAATLELWRPGTLLIPPGGASPRGALGYLAAAFELDEIPARIYAPLGTGTTVAGLLAGLMLREAVTEVVAVRVADALFSTRAQLWWRAFRAVSLLRRFDPAVSRVAPGGVRLRVVGGQGRYGEPTPAALAAIRAARPLQLEPTYTGKTLAVLLADDADGAMFLNTFAPV